MTMSLALAFRISIVAAFLVIATLPVPSQAQSVNALQREFQRVIQLYRAGRINEAAQVAERGLQVSERALGRQHPGTASWLGTLALIYNTQGRFAKAEPLYRRALRINERVLGPQHPSTLTAVANLAEHYRARGRSTSAAKLTRRVLAAYERTLGPNHARTIATRASLAGLYADLRSYRKAEAAYRSALQGAEKILGKGHPGTVKLLSGLGEVYHGQARFGRAETYYRRALAIQRRSAGKDHPSTADVLRQLATLDLARGNYDKAERTYRRVVAINEKAFGPDHPKTAVTLASLAGVYFAQGRYKPAARMFKRAGDISERIFGANHAQTAKLRGALATVYGLQKRYEDAERLLKRTVATIEKSVGRQHKSLVTWLGSLGEIYHLQQRYDEAEAVYTRALTITERTSGKSSPLATPTLIALGDIYRASGRYDAAERFLRRALAIDEKLLGPDHPGTARTRIFLGSLYFSQKEWARATDQLRIGTSVIARRTGRDAQNIGEALTAQKKKESERYDAAFSMLLKSAFRHAQQDRAERDKLAAEMFRTAQWAANSEAAAALSKMAARGAARNSRLGKLIRERQDLINEWQRRDGTRTAALSNPPQARNRPAEAANVKRLGAIDNRIATIDQTLNAQFPDYAALTNPEPLAVADVQTLLRRNEALVLFFDTEKEGPAPAETFVWVVTASASRWVRTGAGTKALRDEVDALRCGLDADGAWRGTRCLDLLQTAPVEGEPLPFRLKRAHDLYRTLFGKVEDLIAGKNLLIVPAGPLTQLPFQVLVTERPRQDTPTRAAFQQASWLIKHHALSVLPSIAALAALRRHAKRSAAKQPFLGYGNPLLDGDPQNEWSQKAAGAARAIRGCAAAGSLRTSARRAINRTKPVAPLASAARLVDQALLRYQSPLPETADELCEVARTSGVPDASLDKAVRLGKAASEAAIKRASSRGVLKNYRVIHFATHGALAGEIEGTSEPGLILTPPRKATRGDDGYLSASEVAALQLDADLVILSACNTAAGGAESAEALSGLARAFFYAGARSLLVSHWYVDSQATVQLITRAFKALRQDARIGRAGALRRAIVALIDSEDRTWHPAYWAPFVVVGEGAG